MDNKYLYSSNHIKVDLLAGCNECLQLGNILQLGVAVQQQSGVVRGSLSVLVQSLQVVSQVVSPICVQVLTYDVRGLQLPNSPLVLHHSPIVIPLLVEMVSVLSEDVHETVRVGLALC